MRGGGGGLLACSEDILGHLDKDDYLKHHFAVIFYSIKWGKKLNDRWPQWQLKQRKTHIHLKKSNSDVIGKVLYYSTSIVDHR